MDNHKILRFRHLLVQRVSSTIDTTGRVGGGGAGGGRGPDGVYRSRARRRRQDHVAFLMLPRLLPFEFGHVNVGVVGVVVHHRPQGEDQRQERKDAGG